MKLKSFAELSEINSPEYKGKLPKYQKTGNTVNKRKVMQYEQDKYSPYQNLLYKRALFGLSIYSEKEVKKMHIGKKKRIQKVHSKAQKSINIFKQEKVNQITSRIFTALFPKSSLMQEIAQCDYTDPGHLNTLDLKSLGITKDDVINRFVHEGILPKDFLKCTQNEITRT
jgi:hypothetical protein